MLSGNVGQDEGGMPREGKVADMSFLFISVITIRRPKDRAESNVVTPSLSTTLGGLIARITDFNLREIVDWL